MDDPNEFHIYRETYNATVLFAAGMEGCRGLPVLDIHLLASASAQAAKNYYIAVKKNKNTKPEDI